jgi:hypothetical protein
MPPEVAEKFAAFPPDVRECLEQARGLIFRVAAATPGVGPLTETLKWGEPAYLTEATGSGSAPRLGWPRSHPNRAAVYFNCKTMLVGTFREMLPGAFEYVGDRALLLRLDEPVDESVLSLCLAMALTYHLRKAKRAVPVSQIGGCA